VDSNEQHLFCIFPRAFETGEHPGIARASGASLPSHMGSSEAF